MSEENKHNDLDQFFKSRLNNPDGESNWNNPSDAIFDGAMAVLDNDQRKRRGILFLLLALLLGVVLGYFLWSQMHINKLQSQIDELASTLDLERNRVGTAIIQDSLAKDDAPKIEEPSIEMGEGELPEVKSNVQTSAQNKSTFTDAIDNGDFTAHNRIVNIAYSGPTEHPKSSINIDVTHKSLLMLDYKATQLGPAVKVDVPQNVTGNPPQIMKSSTAWGMSLGANWTSLSMTALNPLPNNLTKYDNWYAGYQYGINYKRSIKKSRIGIIGSMSYTLSRNQSLFEDNPTYNEAMEASVGGNLRYQAQYDFESPIGAYREPVDFQVDGSIPNASPMHSEMLVQNNFKIYSLNLGASYALMKQSKWQTSLITGFGFNYISEMSHDFEFKLEHEQEVLSQFAGQVADLAGLNRVYPSLYAGFEGTRSLGPWELGLNGTYERSVSSIRKVDPIMQVKTQMVTIKASFLFRYKF